MIERRDYLRPILRSARLILVTLVLVVSGAPSVEAFKLGPHEAITRAALGQLINADGLNWVVGSFAGGTGNLGSDRDQASAARHFDSARSPAEICDRWTGGLNAFIQGAVTLSAPTDLGVSNRRRALETFGEATHALQDFYSHSNWVELAVAAGKTPSVASLSDACVPATLPPTLQTGYYSASPFWSNGGPLVGCPNTGPPPPFAECHSTLNKDSPTKGHGAEAVPGQAGITFHALARTVATQATRELWTAFGRRLAQTYTPELFNVNAECLFRSLATGSGDLCQDLRGRWRFKSGSPTAVVSVTQVGSQVDARYDSAVSCQDGGPITAFFRGAITGPTLSGEVNGCPSSKIIADCFGSIIALPFSIPATLTSLRSGLLLSVDNPLFNTYYDAAGRPHCDPTGRTEVLTLGPLVRSS